MEDVFAAAMSLSALAGVIILSGWREDVNPGFAAMALAVLVGGLWTGLSGAEVLGLFPAELFATLTGVMLFFGMARENGTLDNLTARALRLSRGRTVWMPWAIYGLASLTAMAGPGNIAATALMAPVAMAAAGRVGLSAFLMTLLIVGGANGAAFSPIAPTGAMSNGLIARMAPALGLEDPGALGWRIHLYSLLAQGALNVGGFLLLGGWAWMRRQRNVRPDMDALAPEPGPLGRGQKATAAAMGFLVAALVLPGLPGLREVVPPALARMAHVGAVSFLLAGVLAVSRSADARGALKRMPWDVILMVCGVTVLIQVAEKAGGLQVMVRALGAVASPASAPFWLALLAGLLSIYSSSSGVVMPLLLPLVPSLIQEVGGGAPSSFISSINIGSHLVDTSPFSTLGALCIACAPPQEDRGKLFRKMLAWGLSMAFAGAAVCGLMFGPFFGR